MNITILFLWSIKRAEYTVNKYQNLFALIFFNYCLLKTTIIMSLYPQEPIEEHISIVKVLVTNTYLV